MEQGYSFHIENLPHNPPTPHTPDSHIHNVSNIDEIKLTNRAHCSQIANYFIHQAFIENKITVQDFPLHAYVDTDTFHVKITNAKTTNNKQKTLNI